MKILITGGAGFVGGRVAKFLQAQGYEIYLGTRQDCSSFDWLPEAHVFHSDWNNIDSFKEICKTVDIVIHAAGANAIVSQTDPVKAFHFNGMKTAELVDIAEKSNVKKFIYLSTAHVYCSPLAGQITEISCPRNLHPYATSHLVGEYSVLGNGFYKSMEGVVVRLSNAFGAPVDESVNCWMLLVNDLCKQAIVNKKLVLNSSGLQYRDFISLNFVENAISFLIDNAAPCVNHGIFNVGNGKSNTAIEMAEKIQQRCNALFGYIPEIRTQKAKAGEKHSGLTYVTEKLRNSGLKHIENADAEIDATLQFCRKAFGGAE